LFAKIFLTEYINSYKPRLRFLLLVFQFGFVSINCPQHLPALYFPRSQDFQTYTASQIYAFMKMKPGGSSVNISFCKLYSLVIVLHWQFKSMFLRKDLKNEQTIENIFSTKKIP